MAYVNFYHSKTEEEALEASVQTGNTGKVYFSNDATTIVKNGVKYGSIAENIKGLQVKDTSFIFQQVGGGLNTPSGLAQLTALRGKSVVWNQLVQNGDFNGNIQNWEAYNSANISVAYGSRSLIATAIKSGYGYSFGVRQFLPSFDTTHIYLARAWVKSSIQQTFGWEFGIGILGKTTVPANVWYKIYARDKVAISGKIFIIKPNSYNTPMSVGDTYELKNVCVFDLTLMFGAGNEPSTVEEFEAMFPNGYYPYNTRSLLNFNAESLKTVGFNQYNPSTSKAHVLQGVVYHIQGPYTSLSLNGATITPDGSGLFTPASTGYLTVSGGGSNTCINISDPAKNGTYEPYWESNLPLNISTQTGKLNGSGDSVVVFPNGMARMNGVQDTIVGNVATKKFTQIGSLNTLDIALNYEGYEEEEGEGNVRYSFNVRLPKKGKDFTLNALFSNGYEVSNNIEYNSSNNFCIKEDSNGGYIEIMDENFAEDARFADEEQWDALIADIRTSLADKVLMYELLSYENYTLDDMAMPLSYKIDKNGTEQIIPSATDPDNIVPSTVPCDITVKYKLSYTEESQKLFDNVSATQEQDFTNIQKNIARENIGITADDIHLWDSSILENMNLYSQAFYMDINKASSLGATRVDVGGNMNMRALWEKSAVSVLMDENGNYCELNPNDNRYTKEGDYLLNEDGTIVSAFAHCDFMKIIPLTYGRVQMVTENGNTFPRLWLSLIPLPGGYIIPQQVVAKFKASLVSNKMRSLPGLVTADNNTINAFWTKAQARSKNHGLANLDFRNHLLFHMMSKYAYRDSQNCKGSDNTPIWGVGLDGTENSGGWDGQKNIKTGIVLSLGDYDGNVATTDANSNTCHCVNVAGFENPWGQKWEMVQGLCSVGTDVYCWRNNWLPTGTPTAESFAHVEHVKLTRATSAVWAMNIIESQQGQGVYMIPKQSLSGVSYGDNFYYAEAGQLWLWGGNSSYGSNCGLASAYSSDAWSASYSRISARLAYYGSLNKVSATKMKELGNS